MSEALARDRDGNALNALASLARRAPDGALVALETAGLAAALSIYAWAPGRWPLILPCIALSAYGIWGLCDRFVQSRSGRRFMTQRRIARSIARLTAAVGIAAALGGAYVFMGWLMGVYIS